MAYDRILVAVDGFPARAHALKAGAEIAAAANAELVVLRVVDDPWPFIEPGEVEVKRAMRDGSWQVVAAERVSEELRQRLASATLGPIRTRTAVRFGVPGVEIARGAELERADLVVLGRMPAGLHEAHATGRTIEGTLGRARVPCLIVPSGQHAWRRLLVLPGSGVAASEILHQAFAFADTFGSEVVVLEIESAVAQAEATPTETLGRQAFATWIHSPRAGMFDVMVREGGAAGLLEAARDTRADLLVIGYPRGETLETPSVAPRIVEGARYPLLTVPI